MLLRIGPCCMLLLMLALAAPAAGQARPRSVESQQAASGTLFDAGAAWGDRWAKQARRFFGAPPTTTDRSATQANDSANRAANSPRTASRSWQDSLLGRALSIQPARGSTASTTTNRTAATGAVAKRKEANRRSTLQSQQRIAAKPAQESSPPVRVAAKVRPTTLRRDKSVDAQRPTAPAAEPKKPTAATVSHRTEPEAGSASASTATATSAAIDKPAGAGAVTAERAPPAVVFQPVAPPVRDIKRGFARTFIAAELLRSAANRRWQAGQIHGPC